MSRSTSVEAPLKSSGRYTCRVWTNRTTPLWPAPLRPSSLYPAHSVVHSRAPARLLHLVQWSIWSHWSIPSSTLRTTRLSHLKKNHHTLVCFSSLSPPNVQPYWYICVRPRACVHVCLQRSRPCHVFFQVERNECKKKKKTKKRRVR